MLMREIQDEQAVNDHLEKERKKKEKNGPDHTNPDQKINTSL